MAREVLTLDQVEEEIQRLQKSPMVKLAARERAVRNRRRQYLYWLRQQEKKGKQLTEAGVTMESLDGINWEQGSHEPYLDESEYYDE